MEEIVVGETVAVLLHANGLSDRLNGIDKNKGWEEICNEFGWNPYNQTPAREKYEDGYYGA